MKAVRIISQFTLVCLLVIFNSCGGNKEGETDPIAEDPIDETGFTFAKATQNVTVNLCDQSYCSVNELIFLTENIGYAVTGVDLYRTRDGGLNWEQFTNNDIVGRLIVLSEDLMFLNTYDGILRTINGAASWTVIERPLEFTCATTGSINTGNILFVDELNGFIQDKCYKGQLYRTSDSGSSWELIYNSEDSISAYHFHDALNGFVIVNGTIYLTDDGGDNWLESEVLPNTFDYVIEKEDQFLFPEGIPNVDKPAVLNENVSVRKFDVNDNGDIAVILYDDSVETDNWQLMLYVNDDQPEWILVDQLGDLTGDNAWYSCVHLTNERTMYLGIYSSGEILKYYID